MCLEQNRSQRTCYSRFAVVTVFPVPASVLTEQSETAATGIFKGISVRIATARSRIKPARSSLTRRSHSGNSFFRTTFLGFNTSFRQLQCEIEVTYKTIHGRVERFAEALDASSLDLRGPVEIHEFYVSAGLARRGRGTYEQDKPSIFVLVDRGTEQRYVVLAKFAGESTFRILLADR